MLKEQIFICEIYDNDFSKDEVFEKFKQNSLYNTNEIYFMEWNDYNDCWHILTLSK